MRRRRHLLLQGNQKIGSAIHNWSLPAVTSCPGASELCKEACYARKHRFGYAVVRRRLQWNWRQCLRDDFVERMVSEIRSRGVLVLRVHVSGDFWSVEYVERWLEIMRQAPRVRFYAYTRSWRIPSLAAALEKLAALSCMRLWYSTDDECGSPANIPANVRLAYLQTSDAPAPSAVDLLFRVRRLRKLPALPVICPSETPAGHASQITCGACRRCFD